MLVEGCNLTTNNDSKNCPEPTMSESQALEIAGSIILIDFAVLNLLR